MSEKPKALILVVDDEPDILVLHRFILEQADYEVITAGDGVDAIQKAIDFTPDVIVLDVMMPRMNGYQVCRLLKNDRRTAAIPIIISTVKSLESEKLYAYTSGADHYLVKPFDKEELLERVQASIAGVTLRRRDPLNEEETPRSRTTTDSILSDVNSLLDRRLMELTILQEFTKAMSSTLDLDGVLQVVRRSLRDLGYPDSRVLVMGEDGLLEERVAEGEPLKVDSRRFDLFSRVLTENEVVVVDADRFSSSSPAEMHQAIHASEIVLVPVKSKGNPVGLVLIENSSGQRVVRSQKEFFLTLASQAGLAIENANLYEKTLRLSITDGLTEIYNYRYFCQRLDRELSRAKRYGHTLGLLIIDIDHFKMFNDRYGHLLGDDVLRSAAAIIKSKTRDVDVVARYGGEEFSVILSEIDVDEAVVYAERVREAVDAFGLTIPGGEKIGVTVSLGVAINPNGETGEKEFISRADQALYRAKELGRNRACLWGESGCHVCPPLEDAGRS